MAMSHLLALPRPLTISAAAPPRSFRPMAVNRYNKAERRQKLRPKTDPAVVPKSVYGRADFEYGLIKVFLPGISPERVSVVGVARFPAVARTLGPEIIISDNGTIAAAGDDHWHCHSILISGILVPCFSAHEFSTAIEFMTKNVPFKGKMLGLFNMAHPQLQQDMIGHTAKTIYKSLHKSHHYLDNEHLLQKVMNDHSRGIPADTASFMALLEIYASGMPSVNMEMISSGRIAGIMGAHEPQPAYSVYHVGESSGTQSSSHGDDDQLPESYSPGANDQYTVIPVDEGPVNQPSSFQIDEGRPVNQPSSGYFGRIRSAITGNLARVQGYIGPIQSSITRNVARAAGYIRSGGTYTTIPANDIEAQRLNGVIPETQPSLSDQVSIGIAGIGATIDIGVLVKTGANESPSVRDYVVSFIALVGIIFCILAPFKRSNNPKRSELLLKIGAASTVGSVLVLNASVFKNVTVVCAVAALLGTFTVSVLMCV